MPIPPTRQGLQAPPQEARLPRNVVNSPWRQDAIPRQKPKPQGPKHDRLCLDSVDGRGKPLGLGLRFCWCTCGKCWDPLRRSCICYSCSCRRSG